MEPTEFIKEQIRLAIPAKIANISELAKQAGVNQPNLTEFMKGKRKSMNLDTAWKIMHVLGIEPERQAPGIIKRIGSNARAESVEGDNLIKIPIFETAGAGVPADFFAVEPEKFIYVLPQYAQQNLGAIEVTGDSMEPTIKKGSVVGVIPVPSNLDEGHIYLIRKPPFGLLVKRVRMNGNGEIVLKSDNKDYPDMTITYEGYEDIIVGKVVWVWQSV